MDSKYHKSLFCYISISFLLLFIIINSQSIYVSSVSFDQISANNIVNSTTSSNNDNNTINYNIKTNNNNNDINNSTDFDENRVKLGPDREIVEGSFVSLSPVISNAISLPSKSV